MAPAMYRERNGAPTQLGCGSIFKGYQLPLPLKLCTKEKHNSNFILFQNGFFYPYFLLSEPYWLILITHSLQLMKIELLAGRFYREKLDPPTCEIPLTRGPPPG